MTNLKSISSGLQSVAKLIMLLLSLAGTVNATDIAPFATIAGVWNCHMSTGQDRVYTIGEDGSVNFKDSHESNQGKLSIIDGQFAAEFSDRWQVFYKASENVLKIESYNPKSRFEKKEPNATGTGHRNVTAAANAPTPNAPALPPNTAAEPKPILHSVEEILAAADTTKSLKPFDSVDRDAIQQMTRSLQANNGKEIEIEIQPVQVPRRDGEAQFRWQLPPVKSGASLFTPILMVNAFRDDAPTALGIVPGKSGMLHGVIQHCSVAYGNGPLLYVYIQASSLTSNARQTTATATTVPSPATASAPQPASSAPAQTEKNIRLNAGWDTPMQGGSKTLEDLAFVLNGFAKADPNPPFEDVEIYNGVKYLMPLTEAAAALGIKGRLPSMKKVVCPGFPRDSLNYTSFDGLFEGHYNRMDIVTDMANQVVTIQFVDEHPKDTSYVSYLLKGNWLTYNFVGYRVKALTTLSVDYSLEAYDLRQSRWLREKPEYLAKYYPASPALRVFTYLMDRHQIGKLDRRLEETLWCVPRPFASLLLYCASKGQR